MRRFLCIFLLMLLPLHGFAMQAGWLAAGDRFDIAHEVEHREATSHHHGDDGSVHYDDSGESAAHFADHSASSPQSASLPSVAMPLLRIEPFTVKPSETAYYIPDPFLEHPQRPPTSLG